MNQRLWFSVAMVISLATVLPWSCRLTWAGVPANPGLVNGNTRFALDLYGYLREEGGNLFVSPYSVSTALAMTYAGARGETARQMSKVLHFTLKGEDLHGAFGRLQVQLEDAAREDGVELRVANGLWVDRGHSLLDTFLAIVRKNYQAEARRADFKRAYEPARIEINSWVEKQTGGKIRDLMKPGVLDSLTRLVLVNAIYFKGLWVAPFDKDMTENAPFWVTPERAVGVPTMHQEGEFNYMGDGELQVLELPYAGGDLSMVALLPRKGDGLAGLEESLAVERLNKWLGRLRAQKVIIFLPRFEMTSQFDLNQVLGAMGMPNAFNPEAADFSGMDGTRGLYLSAVLHKAFVEVTEEGTEAAGATGVAVGVTSVVESLPVFRADHPFLFLIRHNPSGSILFIGRVLDPTK